MISLRVYTIMNFECTRSPLSGKCFHSTFKIQLSTFSPLPMPDSIRCIIVDDDRMSLRILQSLVEKTDFLSLTGAYDNALQAARALVEQEVDLLFLDVEMPDMTGWNSSKRWNANRRSSSPLPRSSTP
jgi:PleD family two-component response regulator